MKSLKTILFMGFSHGLVTVYLPLKIGAAGPALFEPGPLRWLALPLWLIGGGAIIWCSRALVRTGRGTPLLADPPRELVILGLYRFVRNPIYLGALVFVSGTLLWFPAPILLAYLVLMLLAFHFLIVVFEEPMLRATFGAQYEAYARAVPRWIPRLRSDA